MTQFRYLAFDTSGAPRRGAVMARDEAAARQRLAARMLLPVSLVATVDVGARGRRLPVRTLAIVIQQLAVLSRSGAIDVAVSAVAAQASDPAARALLERLGQRMAEGSSLAGAMAAPEAAALLPPLVRAMVAAGEASGTLPAMLHHLAAVLDRQAALRGRLVTALAYPAILAAVATVVIVAMLTLVVPRLAGEISGMGATLPLITRVVIFASNALIALAPVLLFAALAGVWWLKRHWQDPAAALARDASLLRLPLAGPLLGAAALTRALQTLAATLAGGLPVEEALALAGPAAGNRAMAGAIAEVRCRVVEGRALAPSLAASALVPPMVAALVASGESSDTLAEMLGLAATIIEREAQARTATLVALIEPVIIIVMAAAVAVIVLAVLMPILQLDTLALG